MTSELLIPGKSGDSPVAQKLSVGLRNPGLIFVFPTQIAADSWAEAALEFSGFRSINLDRFLGWDRFLEKARIKNQGSEAREADLHFRLLWATNVLEKDGKNPFLQRLGAQGSEPAPALVWNLAASAPFLDTAEARLQARAATGNLAFDETLASDYRMLAAHYKNYLRTHNVYESGNLPLQGMKDEYYLFFYPSLMPGFDDALSLGLKELNFELWEPVSPDAKLLEFPSLKDELDYVLGACRALLDKGQAPSGIAISIPGTSQDLAAYLSQAARSWGLPIKFRFGRSLSDSPPGRLFRNLSQALAEGFSQRSLLALFDPSILPWKDTQACLALERVAKRFSIPELSAHPGYMQEIWNNTLQLCTPEESAVPAFYRLLKKSCNAIVRASSFRTLDVAIHGFVDDFLDESRFYSYAERTLERIFAELGALEAWDEELLTAWKSLRPFEIFQCALEHRTYNPVESSEALSVYPYHLGIMVSASVHFVLEASQDSANGALGILSRAPEELALPRDDAALSDSLFNSFATTKALYCHAQRSLNGYSIAHPYFSLSSAQKINVGPDSIPQTLELREAAAWKSINPATLPTSLPFLPYTASHGLFTTMLAGPKFLWPPLFLQSDAEEPRAKPNQSLLFRLKAFNAEPLIKLNPRGLQFLSLCPFRWLSSGIPDFDQAGGDQYLLAEGSLLHDMIRILLEARSRGEKPSLESTSGEEAIERAFAMALARVARKNGPSLTVHLESSYPRIHDRIARILAYEPDFVSEGWVENEFERRLSMDEPSLGIRLDGRADRISYRSHPGQERAEIPHMETALVDYKRRRCPTKKEFLADESGLLKDFQITAYTVMLESENVHMEKALYWSIDEDKAVIVFGPGGDKADRAAFEPEIQAFRKALAEASEKISAARFLEIKPSKDACRDCHAKAVCRAHFSSERV